MKFQVAAFAVLLAAVSVPAGGLASEHMPPGSSKLLGFADNNYPGGPIAVTSCAATIERHGGKARATAVIGIINTSPNDYALVNVNYAIVAFSKTYDAVAGGSTYIEATNLRPFEYRELRQTDTGFPMDQVQIASGMTCSIADVQRRLGANVRYPHPTDYGDDKQL